jgi:tetratricopeptide (TPR) repeat protein
MQDAQAHLADAYLTGGQALEARVIAEDLVAREPWERAHIDRFRRALVMLKVSDPDSVIAERLSGQAPFMATDPFADIPDPIPAVTQPDAVPDAAEESQPDATAVETTPAAVEHPEPAAPPGPSPVGSPASEEFDLTGALGEMDPGESPAGNPPETSPQARSSEEKLEETFKEFRSEVARQSGLDQSAQHMTLARTYLEMGMPDEAMTSLKVASRATRYRFEAASLLARIHKERGEHAPAIEWLERAAEAPAPSVEEGRALLYDLGTLVEHSGETARALAIFLELQSEAGEYRDVAERVERLARVETGG